MIFVDRAPRAMAVAMAMIYPEPERGRGMKDAGKKGAETASFSYRPLAEARQVLAHSRDYASVMMPSGTGGTTATSSPVTLFTTTADTELVLATIEISAA
jgi:hypothetical protein